MDLTGKVAVAKPIKGKSGGAVSLSGNISPVQRLGAVVASKKLVGSVLSAEQVSGAVTGKDRSELSDIIVRSGVTTFVEVPAKGFYGIGSVTVEGDEDLTPENIKLGVTVLGVVGKYAPEDPKLAAKTLDVTENGTYTVTPGSGYDGMSRVRVNVDVPQEVTEVKVDAELQSKSVTPSASAQTVRPDEGYDALSFVTVAGDSDLKPENIVEGVTIFGVEGTYEKRDLQSKSVTPGSSGKTVKPDGEFEGLSSVYVVGDSDLIPANIREGVDIFGVVGNYSTGQEYQDKTVTPGRNPVTVTADEGYNALAKVTVEGDSKLVPENIAAGVTIFGVSGSHVSPMKPVTVVPSRDEQHILPAAGFYGFSSITVAPIDVTGEYTDGYADGAASRDNEVEVLEDRIDTLTNEKNAAYDDGYEDGYADGAASGGGGGGGGGEGEDTKATHYLYGTPNSEGNVILQTFIGDMRFDGAVLPKLPEWDRGKYPYVLMGGYMFNPKYRLVFSAQPYGNYSDKDSLGYFAEETEACVCDYDTKTGTWESVNPYTGFTQYYIQYLYWANYDITSADDGAFLNASAPIPLASNEPIGYTDDNIPIYEQKE